MNAKLTGPQRELLLEVGRHEKQKLTCDRYYPPAKKLVALGLARFWEARIAGGGIELTETGVAEYQRLVRAEQTP